MYSYIEIGKQRLVTCPLCPRKRTFVSALSMSALCQKQTWLGYRKGNLSANIRVLVSIDSDPELHKRRLGNKRPKNAIHPRERVRTCFSVN